MMTEAEYLQFERAHELKHEFHAGEVLAMTGASRAHNLICTNLVITLGTQLRGQPCEVYANDMRVRVQPARLYTYPDISVACDEPQFTDDHVDTLINPTLIIEVLSPSTERYDRGRKFQHYREVSSLREYVLIAQDSPRIERFLRRDSGLWELTDAHGLDASLNLESIGCTLTLADAYERITFVDEESQ